MKHVIKYYLIFGIVLMTQLLAQPGGPGAPDQAPIGSLALLALALGGSALGYKKLSNRKK